MCQALNKALSHWFRNRNENNWQSTGDLLQCLHGRTGGAKDDVWRQTRDLRGSAPSPLNVKDAPTVINREIATDPPAQFLQALLNDRFAHLRARIDFGSRIKPAEPPHPLWLL